MGMAGTKVIELKWLFLPATSFILLSSCKTGENVFIFGIVIETLT